MQESNQLFFLGKSEDGAEIQYKNKDLTTHALIIGMTGSGKTGLGVGLIEEAALDGIPSIVIDPKGDMGNLLLSFPNMSKDDFVPWVDPDEAASKNKTVDEFAADTAQMWENGLSEWNEGKERVAALKNSAKFTIYTPAASHGVSVNILSSFKLPSPEVLEDEDMLHMIIASSATSILNLVDIDSDPLASKEHILLSSVFSHYYKNGKDISMEEMINSIVSPPFDKVGVFSLETFFPKDKRMEFAMKINAIMASPSFAAWLKGESMDVEGFLYDKDKKPKVSIFNISHLGDTERMFFVTLLLNNIIAWTRTQEGSSALRAIVYMDEIFGYFPPNSNPPSKVPMLTLLKQARAFGLGVVLSTQNPVDLDYKGLSNIGTWFIGRLQTAQDKERVIEGLIGVKGSDLGKSELMSAISNLKKRHFLLKNINTDGLSVFQTKWTLSYLKGPLSKDQIKKLMENETVAIQSVASNQTETKNRVPSFVSNLEQRYFYETRSENYRLSPYLVCSAKVRFISSKNGIDKEENIFVMSDFSNRGEIKWSKGDIRADFLENKARENSEFDDIVSFVDDAKKIAALQKEALDFISRSAVVELLSVPSLKLEAKADESEDDFMSRAKSELDKVYTQKYDELKAIYDKKQRSLNDKFESLNFKLDKEKSDVQSKTLDTVLNVGSGILGSLFGRKTSGVSKTLGGIKNATRIQKERGDVKRVEQEMAALQDEARRTEEEFQLKNRFLKEDCDISKVEIKKTTITPRKSDIYNERMFILWREV